MKMPRLRIVLGISLLCALFGSLLMASWDVAQYRLYQVDEFEVAYMVGIEAFHRQQERIVSGAIFLLPLMPIARLSLTSAELMDKYRLVFWCLMWVNVLLIARATRVRMRSPLGAGVLLFVATLAPMWDYGFEIRHDNVMLFGTLLLWCLGTPNGHAFRHGYVLIGAVGMLMQFVAFKAIVYWVPLTAALVMFPHPEYRAMHSRLRILAQFVAGAAATLLAIYLLYRHLQLWDSYVRVFGGGTSVAAEMERRNHMDSTLHFIAQSPFVVGSVIALFAIAGSQLRTQGLRFFSWSSAAPECMLATGALGIFIINPTPFRYNLVPLVALFAVAAPRLVLELRDAVRSSEMRTTLVVMFVACHLGPWYFTSDLGIKFRNDRQRMLMSVAEQMTDRKRDRVYAASGLVLTRDSIGYAWFFHSLNRPLFYDGTYPTVRSMLASTPAAVLVPSYRTDFLRGPDKKFIAEHYLPLADDFMVLGAMLSTGNGQYICFQSGRYQVTRGAAGPVSIDGNPVPDDNIVYLTRGPHQITTESNSPFMIRWLGPTLKSLPVLSEASHRRVFIGYL